MSMGWTDNSIVNSDKKPPQHKEVEVLVKGGKILRASWLKDVNKYVQNVNSWHIIGTENYIKDSDVIGWRYICDTNSSEDKKE